MTEANQRPGPVRAGAPEPLATEREGSERIFRFRRRYTMARVESIRGSGGGYLPDELVAEVIDTWTTFFAEFGIHDPVMLETCIREAHEMAAFGYDWTPRRGWASR